ncbi:hypothetical protein REPUB_Repub16aG0041200 [Reevesia pubescens]
MTNSSTRFHQIFFTAKRLAYQLKYSSSVSSEILSLAPSSCLLVIFFGLVLP